MPNVRVSGTSYTNNMRSIVAIPDHYVALSAQIPATAAQTIDGKKYILAGTPVTNATTLEGRKTGLTVATLTEQFHCNCFSSWIREIWSYPKSGFTSSNI